MGNTQSDQTPQPRITTCSDSNYTNHCDINPNVPNSPLSFNILKAITLAFLKTCSDQNCLTTYHSALKKFIEDYEYQRFSGFLGDFSLIIFDEPYTKDSFQSTASNSPSAVDLLDQGLGQPLRTPEYAKMRPSLEIHRQFFSNTLIKSRDLTERVEKFLETETVKKTNFFFEFAFAFGELFAARYQNDLRRFERQCKGINEKSAHQQKTLREEIKAKYEQARQELKHFQNILVYILRSFTVQIHSNVAQSTTLSMKKAFLERLSTKLLFGKNQCYSTYFELIKYYIRDEEAALKRSMTELKNLKPEDFKADARLCMKGSEAPYQGVIDCLIYLDVYTSPYEKFEAISHMNREMMKEIRKEWQAGLSEGNEGSMVELTAEKLIPVNCYCLVESGNFNMKRHQVFMEDFLSKELMNFGDEAYYFITFIASSNFLINIVEDPLQKLRQV